MGVDEEKVNELMAAAYVKAKFVKPTSSDELTAALRNYAKSLVEEKYAAQQCDSSALLPKKLLCDAIARECCFDNHGIRRSTAIFETDLIAHAMREALVRGVKIKL